MPVHREQWKQTNSVNIDAIIYSVHIIGSTIYVCNAIDVKAYNEDLQRIPKLSINTENLSGLESDEEYPTQIVDFVPMNDTDIILATTHGLFHHVLGKDPQMHIMYSQTLTHAPKITNGILVGSKQCFKQLLPKPSGPF